MRTLYASVAFLFLVGCVAAGSTAKEEVVSQPDSVAARRAKRIASGEELWSRCHTCHGRDGRAQTAFGGSHDIPDFTSREWKRSRDPQALNTTIAKGCGPEAAGGTRMPAQGEKLSEDDIHSLVAYIFHLGG